jgi:putative glutamine amidotransferase
LLRAYVEAGKPVLGVCRGCQLINVFFGGTLFQDLPDAQLHTNKTDFYIAHSVSAIPTSVAGKLYGMTFSVNSCHHQAVNALGEGLVATAYWNDRYIEAFEHSTLPIIGFQWHPERMCAGQRRDDTVDGIAIFNHFVDMCKQ